MWRIWVRKRWRWLFTLLLLLLVGITWIVILNIPSEPSGRLLIERQQNSTELFYAFDFSEQQSIVIPYNGTNPIDVAYQISLTADGKQATFIGNHLDDYRIYVTNNTFTDVRPISSGPRDFNPKISPDGSTIAFERLSGYSTALFTVDIATGVEHQLTGYTNDLEADWSPDGKRLVFTTSRDGFQELYTMVADGSDQKQLTNNERQNDLQAKFSPDGKWIAYMSNYSVGDGTGEIWLMEADGGHQRRLTDNQQDDGEPIWSPNSHSIAFTRTKADRSGTDIFIYEIASDQVRQLTASTGYAFQPTWSPDSVWIGFTVNPSGDGQQLIISIIRADGTDQQPLLDGADPIPAGRGVIWTR